MSLYYVYDALCGWCYGFSPVMEAFAEQHKDELEIEVISGGMVTDERIGPIGEVAGYISWAYKDVEKHTGIKFGNHFLENTLKEGTAIFTSIPPAIALSVFKSLKPDESLNFAGKLQKAIYFDGIAPKNLEAYGELAGQFGIDSKDFVKKMQEQKFREDALKDFKMAASLGVQGFPTLVLMKGTKALVLSRGYVDLDQLNQLYEEGRKALQ